MLDNSISIMNILCEPIHDALKDVKTSSTANFSRPSLKTENKSAWLEEPLDQYDILGSKSEFSRDFFEPTHNTNG